LLGCFDYRGYFDASRAEAHAARLRAAGNDVHVGGVAAYSTLGWFDDPLLDTFVGWRDDRLAALLFHELAHRRLFVPGDTAFNESFATAVADAGVRRWLQQRADPAALARYAAEWAWRQQVFDLLQAARETLSALYASDRPDVELQRAKDAQLARLQAQVAALRAVQGAQPALGEWVAAGMNNAKLNAVGLYHRLVPGFSALLHEHDGELPSFYAAVEALGQRPAAERRAYLAARAAAMPAQR
jgi:predicted aminopeptidase